MIVGMWPHNVWCLRIPALTTQVKTADLDPSRSYLLGSHPHGVLCSGAVSAFATEGSFHKLSNNSKDHIRKYLHRTFFFTPIVWVYWVINSYHRTWLEGIIPWSRVPSSDSYDPVLHPWTPRTCLLVTWLFLTRTRLHANLSLSLNLFIYLFSAWFHIVWLWYMYACLHPFSALMVVSSETLS